MENLEVEIARVVAAYIALDVQDREAAALVLEAWAPKKAEQEEIRVKAPVLTLVPKADR